MRPQGREFPISALGRYCASSGNGCDGGAGEGGCEGGTAVRGCFCDIWVAPYIAICDTFRIMIDDPKTVKRQMPAISQIRGARGMLGWTQPQLALAAGLSEPTVKRFETGKAAVSEAAVAKMVAALEAAGVEFTDGEQPGVRLRKAP